MKFARAFVTQVLMSSGVQKEFEFVELLSTFVVRAIISWRAGFHGAASHMNTESNWLNDSADSIRSKPDKEYSLYIIVATTGYTIPLSEAEMENKDIAVARYLMKC